MMSFLCNYKTVVSKIEFKAMLDFKKSKLTKQTVECTITGY